MASRGLAKANIAAKGTASGLAGFMDFKRSFEDAVRKHKWEKERDAEEDRLKRQQMVSDMGYAVKEEDVGRFLSSGEGQFYRPQSNLVIGGEIPEGFEPTYTQDKSGQWRISSLKAEPISKVEARQKNKERSDFIKESAQDTLNTIAEIRKGINYFGLTGALPSMPGSERATWEANVNKLLSGKIISLMTEMKEASKTGATGFGQLSNKELIVLRESSTALKKWLSSKEAEKILNQMEIKLQKILTGNTNDQTSILQKLNLNPNKYEVVME